MSEKLLLQILAEVKDLRTDVNGIKSEITDMKADINGIKSEITGMKADITSMKAQLDENTQIIKVIRDRQEETDAKLENLTMDVHQMRGEVTALAETVEFIKKELAFTSHKAYTNEKDIFNLLNRSSDSKIG